MAVYFDLKKKLKWLENQHTNELYEGHICDFERRGLPSFSEPQIGLSVAHSSLNLIIDLIYSMIF